MADFVLPDGSLFDLSVGLGNDQQTHRFQGYGIFMEKTREVLLKYGRRPKRFKHLNHIGAEVGDDEIGVDSTPEYAAAKTVVFSEFLGMKVSEADTSINPRFGNYAEDLLIVPDGYEQTYRYASQTSDFRNMSFLDVPKLRLAIDIRPGRMEHSSTNDGKAGMLGSRLAWLPRGSPVRCLWEVFNLFQDINLGLIRDDKFAYLPTALGGYGKPVPFGKASNFEAFAIRYKQGTHASLARELVRRANKRFRDYTVANRYSIDPVLSAVSRLQSSWHDWIKGKSLYAPTCWLEAPPEVVQYRVPSRHGEDVRIDSVLRRLQSASRLVTESDLAIAYEHNQLCQYLLGEETHKAFIERRKAARSQWLNLSTFSLRLYGYLEKLGVDQSMHHALRDSEVTEFSLNIRERRLNLRAFLRQEYFYDAKAMDLVYANGPMMVNIPLMPRVTSMGRRYWFEQTRDKPDDIEVDEEFDSLLTWVMDNPKESDPPSTRAIADDPFLLEKVRRAKSEEAFAIVTDDCRLCREIYNKTRKWIVRVPVKWYYMDLYYGDANQPWLAPLETRFPFLKWQTLEDTGSIESFEEIGFRDGSPIAWPAERPFVMTKPSFRNGRRLRAQRTHPDLEEDPAWKPYRFPDGYIYSSGNLLQKMKHPYRRGWA